MKQWLFYIICFMAKIAFSQTYTTQDSTRIYYLLNASDTANRFEDGLRYAQQALQMSQKHRLLRGEGMAHLKIAYLIVEQTPNAQVRTHWEKAKEVAHQLNDSLMHGLVYLQQGKYMMYNNKLDSAEYFFNKALSSYFNNKNSSYTTILYNDLGFLSGKKGLKEQEVEWYLKAMKTDAALNNWHSWANTAGNLANTFFKINKKEEAIYYAKEALKIHTQNNDFAGLATVSGNVATMYLNINQLDSAINYQQKAMKYAVVNGQKKHMIQGYSNLSILYDRQKKYPEAMEAIQKSLALCQEINDMPNAASKSRWAAIIASRTGNIEMMNQYYDLAFKIADSLRRMDIVRDIYASKANYFKNKEDYKNAYDFTVKYRTLEDSLTNAQMQKNISEWQIKYESERKDFEIARLNTDKQIRQLELEKQQAIIAGNKLEARKKENEIKLLMQEKQLREAEFLRQKELFEKQILLTKNKEQELALARQGLEISQKDKELKERQLQRQRLIQGVSVGVAFLIGLLIWFLFKRYQLQKELQEKEAILSIRNTISKDIHDEIGSSITNINILNEMTKRSLATPSQAESYLEQTGDNIQRISESLSDIIWNVNPQNDDIHQLLTRMRRYAADMLEGADIDYVIDFPQDVGSIKFSMDKRRHFYLFFREAINNLVKYSKATKAFILLKIQNNTIQLTVKDDGIGFDTQTVTRGNGLNNMQHRANLLRGQFDLTSELQKGTLIQLDISV